MAVNLLLCKEVFFFLLFTVLPTFSSYFDKDNSVPESLETARGIPFAVPNKLRASATGKLLQDSSFFSPFEAEKLSNSPFFCLPEEARERVIQSEFFTVKIE